MKRFLLILGTISLLLVGCKGKSDEVKFNDKQVEFYSLVDLSSADAQEDYADPAKAKQRAYKGNITFKVLPDYPNVLYLDVPSYANLIAKGLLEGYKVESDALSFTVRYNNQAVFAAAVDPSKQEFGFGGSLRLGPAIDTTTAYGSLMVDMKLDQKYIVNPTQTKNSSSYAAFAKDFPVVYQNNQFLAPLSLYDSAFGATVSGYHIFDTQRVLQIGSTKALEVALGEANGSAANVMASYNNQRGMPKDLRLLEKASLYFLLDNYYGLRIHKGIESMSSYMDTQGFGKSLLVENAKERFYNLNELVAVLDDDHTGIVSMAPWWGDTSDVYHRSSRSQERGALVVSNREAREKALGTIRTDRGVDEQVHYSTSGKTAYFYFDGFIFDQNLYKVENRDKLWKTDSYFYFVHQFEEIVKHGGVERVIIDDSCNGGGTVGIAIKLLALISKNNYGYCDQNTILNGAVGRLACQVDSNLDQKYDEKDVYGDDFEISILTSPNSFSCGNLFPIVAKKEGTAKIIGKKSGGGECVVATTILPSGRGFQHSGTSILCTVNNGVIERNFENGAKPDIEIPYCNFYNIDYLEAELTK